MTIEEIKENLPDVKIEFEGKVQSAHVRGRKNKFASVILKNGLVFEYAWQTIERVINNGSYLITEL